MTKYNSPLLGIMIIHVFIGIAHTKNMKMICHLKNINMINNSLFTDF